jgi:hypothetical protein
MTNLKPFNLERALAGDPIVTRDGRKVTEIYYFKTCTEVNCIVCIIDGEKLCYRINGEWSIQEHKLDLFMAPKTKKVYFYINKHSIDGKHYYVTNADTDDFDVSNLEKWQMVEVDVEDVEEETFKYVTKADPQQEGAIVPTLIKTKKLWIGVEKRPSSSQIYYTTNALEDLNRIKILDSNHKYNFIQIEIPEE